MDALERYAHTSKVLNEIVADSRRNFEAAVTNYVRLAPAAAKAEAEITEFNNLTYAYSNTIPEIPGSEQEGRNSNLNVNVYLNGQRPSAPRGPQPPAAPRNHATVGYQQPAPAQPGNASAQYQIEVDENGPGLVEDLGDGFTEKVAVPVVYLDSSVNDSGPTGPSSPSAPVLIDESLSKEDIAGLENQGYAIHVPEVKN